MYPQCTACLLNINGFNYIYINWAAVDRTSTAAFWRCCHGKKPKNHASRMDNEAISISSLW